MYKNHFFLILISLVMACNSGQKNEPENLIPKEKMTDLLYDLYILNASNNLNKIEFENNNLNPEQYIFEKYDIDSVQFAQSNTYYSNNLEIYKGIISEVKTRIGNIKTEVDTLLKREREEKKRKRDSINKLPDSLKSKIKSDLNKPKVLKPFSTNRRTVDSLMKSKR